MIYVVIFVKLINFYVHALCSMSDYLEPNICIILLLTSGYYVVYWVIYW